jgi:hypothetical protein
MGGCTSFTDPHIFRHDAVQSPAGLVSDQSTNQTHWQPGRPAAPTQPRTFRASTDDRTQVTELLQAHYVAGRLDATELEARVERALAAVTLGDLDAVLADLPPLPSAHPTTSRPADPISTHVDLLRCTTAGPKPFRAHAISYLLVMAMLVVIWALTSPGGYFWPVWPMLGWGIGLATHGLAARGIQHGRRAAVGYR